MVAQAGITGARWHMACKTGVTLDVGIAAAEVDHLVIVISRHKIRFQIQLVTGCTTVFTGQTKMRRVSEINPPALKWLRDADSSSHVVAC